MLIFSLNLDIFFQNSMDVLLRVNRPYEIQGMPDRAWPIFHEYLLHCGLPQTERGHLGEQDAAPVYTNIPDMVNLDRVVAVVAIRIPSVLVQERQLPKGCEYDNEY